MIEKVRAAVVHLYTATGLVCAALTLFAIRDGDHRAAFFWMFVAVLIDASDGSLARRYRVREVLPHIDGRRLDDIVDYLNYTFLPLLLIGTAGWIPEPHFLWVSLGLIASVFAFCNTRAKEEDEGFFLGFPSYWNVFAFYGALWFEVIGPRTVLALLLFLSLLSVLPVRFVYPSLARRWRAFFVSGGLVWALLLIAMLWLYPVIPVWLTLISMVYPALYILLSLWLDLGSRMNFVSDSL